MKKFADIIDRVEEIRRHLGLNKSRFAGAIGMKPQTYNNFIGAQGSKPNMELVHGIVEQFKVDPRWLLSGKGQPFQEGADVEEISAAAKTTSQVGWEGQGAWGRALTEIKTHIQEREKVLAGVAADHRSLGRVLSPLLQAYLQVDPVSATREIRRFVERVEAHLEKLTQPSSK